MCIRDSPRWLPKWSRWPPGSPKMVHDSLHDVPGESKTPPSSCEKPPRWPNTAPEAPKRPLRRPKRLPTRARSGQTQCFPSVFEGFRLWLFSNLPTAHDG
eukprot:8623174-Pyramimonas_sp.AAC.1